jgi:hypothetical protein
MLMVPASISFLLSAKSECFYVLAASNFGLTVYRIHGLLGLSGSRVEACIVEYHSARDSLAALIDKCRWSKSHTRPATPNMTVNLLI